jgi:predicted kinase
MKATLLGGVAGSGKTTWTKQNTNNGYVVRFDDYARPDKQGYISPEAVRTAYETSANRVILILSSGHSVVYDAPNLTMNMRKQLITRIKSYTTEIDGVWFKSDFKQSIQRLRRKKHTVPISNLLLFHVCAEPFLYEEGFSNVSEFTTYRKHRARKTGVNFSFPELRFLQEKYELFGSNYKASFYSFISKTTFEKEMYPLLIYSDLAELLWEYAMEIDTAITMPKHEDFLERFFNQIVCSRYPQLYKHKKTFLQLYEQTTTMPFGRKIKNFLLKLS